MSDDTSTAASAGVRETDLPMPDAAPASESVVVRAACHAQDAPSSTPLPAGESAHRGIAPPRARLYVVAAPLDDYYAEAVVTGTVAAIESEAGRQAPIGALIVRDADDGERGVVVAERVLTGWLLHGGAPS